MPDRTDGNPRQRSLPARPRRWPLVIAVLVIVAAVGGAIAISVLGTRDGTDEMSPSVAPSSSSSPSASASSPMEEATPSVSIPDPSTAPSATPQVVAPGSLLPPGSVVILTANNVRLRSEPSPDAPIVATMAAGDAAYVEDSIYAGPIRMGGYDWYQLSHAGGDDVWPWQDLAPHGLVRGWAAAGSDAGRFMEIAEVTCPSEPVTISSLAQRFTSWERLICFGDEPITIEGTFGCEECPFPVADVNPRWLAAHTAIGGRYMYWPLVALTVPPDMRTPENRDIVRATLTVDHPDAGSCSYSPWPEASGPSRSPDAAMVELYCRERLVLDAFEVIGRDDFGE